ncbi:hypothetical protein GCM10022255_095950 [Dactylosporangium darangshiense]|uniref:Uncharacterized protein n=1 Tax=Dactylosporangium darangshiense TaxID=579108 RepID=A0ABP8DQK5_9ACTN
MGVHAEDEPAVVDGDDRAFVSVVRVEVGRHVVIVPYCGSLGLADLVAGDGLGGGAGDCRAPVDPLRISVR